MRYKCAGARKGNVFGREARVFGREWDLWRVICGFWRGHQDVKEGGDWGEQGQAKLGRHFEFCIV